LFSAGEYAFTKTTNSLYVKFNPILLDILVSNLLKNALTHNETGGKIIIELENNKFTIKNSGAPLKLDANDIFKRFVKDNTNKNNSGLGLEIVRKICDYYGIAVNYSYENQLHCFVVDFVNVAEKI
jgi:signal transduction histidine kinase